MFAYYTACTNSCSSSRNNSSDSDVKYDGYLVLPTGETEMTELMEGVGDVGLEEAEDEADNGRIWDKQKESWPTLIFQ